MSLIIKLALNRQSLTNSRNLKKHKLWLRDSSLPNHHFIDYHYPQGESQTDPTAANENRKMQTGGTGTMDPNALKKEEEEVGDKFYEVDPNLLLAHLILQVTKEPAGGELGVALKPSQVELFQM